MDKDTKIIKATITQLAKKTLGYESEDTCKNLFDIFAAHEILYLLDAIEHTFSVDIAQIVLHNDYSVMSIDELATKIELL